MLTNDTEPKTRWRNVFAEPLRTAVHGRLVVAKAGGMDNEPHKAGCSFDCIRSGAGDTALATLGLDRRDSTHPGTVIDHCKCL